MAESNYPPTDGEQLASEARAAREAHARLEPGQELITVVDRDQVPRLFRVMTSFGPQRGDPSHTALVILEHIEKPEVRQAPAEPERDWMAEAKAASPAAI